MIASNATSNSVGECITACGARARGRGPTDKAIVMRSRCYEPDEMELERRRQVATHVKVNISKTC
jgi:hypothetical protein